LRRFEEERNRNGDGVRRSEALYITIHQKRIYKHAEVEDVKSVVN
jgi:hypothetical protein